MKKKLIVLSGFGLSLMPVIALAAGTDCAAGRIYGLEGVMCKVKDLLDSVVPVLIALGVVYFVWGVISYMIGADEEQKKKGRDKIIYGIIGLAVIVSMWGLVNILTDTFGVGNQNKDNIIFPTLD